MVKFSELFYGGLPLLHAFGAILALSLSFACDTGRAKQTARVPYRLPLPAANLSGGSNFSWGSDRAFLAAYPWDEGGEFVTHEWNPFALIFVFEWLTAGFALRPLMYFTYRTALLLQVWLAWLAAGVFLFLIWTLTNSGGYCVAMLCTVLASFALSMGIAYLSLQEATEEAVPTNRSVNPAARMAAHRRGGYEVLQGRVWWVPRSVAGLRYRGLATEDAPAVLVGEYAQGEVDQSQENSLGVVTRYLEYCITAPLLFLAVVCLLVVDAPAWLLLTGYWLLVTCNAVGIALHACFCSHASDKTLRDSGGWFGFLVRLFFANPWSDPGVNQNCLLQAAWVCLLVPMCGLIFLTRDVLFDPDMPALVLALIWNLLLTYSLFGIVSTVVYITGMGRNHLAWLLDILNVLAKFPLPLIILSGFITRPATNKFCFNG